MHSPRRSSHVDQLPPPPALKIEPYQTQQVSWLPGTPVQKQKQGESQRQDAVVKENENLDPINNPSTSSKVLYGIINAILGKLWNQRERPRRETRARETEALDL